MTLRLRNSVSGARVSICVEHQGIHELKEHSFILPGCEFTLTILPMVKGASVLFRHFVITLAHFFYLAAAINVKYTRDVICV